MMDRKVFCHITFEAEEKSGFKSVVWLRIILRLMPGNRTGEIVTPVDCFLCVIVV